MLSAEVVEKSGHRPVLVFRARKVEREAAPGELRRDFGVVAYCATDAGDIGTCETMAVW